MSSYNEPLRGSGDAGAYSNSVACPDKRSQGRLILGDCASLLHDPAAESVLSVMHDSWIGLCW